VGSPFLRRFALAEGRTIVEAIGQEVHELSVGTGQHHAEQLRGDEPAVRGVAPGSNGLSYWTGFDAEGPRLFVRRGHGHFDHLWPRRPDPTLYSVGGPILSPDGARIAFAARRRDVTAWSFDLE
jgi:hypothetical protein